MNGIAIALTDNKGNEAFVEQGRSSDKPMERLFSWKGA